MAVFRGDIFYVYPSDSFGSEQRSGRPAIIVSNDQNNKHSPCVEVIYLTTQNKDYLPTHVTIKSSPKESTALCEQIHTVSVDRLGDFAGRITLQEMQQIDVALLISLQLDDYVPQSDDQINRESDLQKQLSAMITKYETIKELYDSLLQSVMQR